ncbi:DUF2442 domain-containing protein [Pseudoduganella sp. LjRoot289]|uniref:DUF2442 domain-containing protein n=1 Tax=Pseudoduganella sp. LjRoot289 TaxID=3342314 RepID=UPI003ED14A76
MHWDVIEVQQQDNYSLWVRFNDGVEGAVQFMPSAFRGVFTHLSDKAKFGQVTIVDGVITWPGDLDLAPDAMHAEIKRNGICVLT